MQDFFNPITSLSQDFSFNDETMDFLSEGDLEIIRQKKPRIITKQKMEINYAA